MLNIVDKKQIIHIVAEIIIIVGISVYFSQKNKHLLNLINDLTQRLEDQEEQINKHEQAINNLSLQISKLNSNNSNEKLSNPLENLIQQNLPIPTRMEPHFINTQPKMENFMNFPINVPNNNVPTTNNQPVNKEKKKSTKKKVQFNEVENTNEINENNINELLSNIPLQPSIPISMPMPTIVIGTATRVQKPVVKENSSSKVEEIFDENEEEFSDDKNEEDLLDEELEEELKELE
jgi:hypothetical protein